MEMSISEENGLILSPIITICQFSEYANALEDKEKQLYLEKLVKYEIDCPFFIPKHNWVV